MPRKRRQVRHGTYQGYMKHNRVRKEPWAWPPCDKCREASVEGRRVKQANLSTEARETRRDRDTARQRALMRLKAEHNSEYTKYYAEELSIIKDGGELVVSNLEAQLRKLTTARREQLLVQLVGDGSATVAERNEYFEIHSLRARIVEARERVAARAAAGGS